MIITVDEEEFKLDLLDIKLVGANVSNTVIDVYSLTNNHTYCGTHYNGVIPINWNGMGTATAMWLYMPVEIVRACEKIFANKAFL